MLCFFVLIKCWIFFFLVAKVANATHVQTNKSSTGTAAEISNIVTETKDSESDCLIIQGTTGEEKTYGDNIDVN